LKGTKWGSLFREKEKSRIPTTGRVLKKGLLYRKSLRSDNFSKVDEYKINIKK
jgi:hypothetical protein